MEGLTARLEHVHVTFGEHAALRDVDLDVPADGVTVLLGRSGSGKTTLLRTLNRMNELYAGHRFEGKVTVRLGGTPRDAYGRDMDVAWLRRRVAMVFQSPNVLPLSVEKNLLVPLKLAADVTGAAARERMEAALADAELLDEVKDRLGAPAPTLSGGQQQRLCLARALALDPEILLLDEPTASLDVRAEERIERLIARLAQRYPVVAVSHGLAQAVRIANRAVVLRDGAIVRILERAQLADPDRLRALVEEAF